MESLGIKDLPNFLKLKQIGDKLQNLAALQYLEKLKSTAYSVKVKGMDNVKGKLKMVDRKLLRENCQGFHL